MMESHETPFMSTAWACYGVSIVRILEKIDRIITGPIVIDTVYYITNRLYFERQQNKSNGEYNVYIILWIWPNIESK